MMADMKAHFQTATNTVAAHNAAMLQEASCCRLRWQSFNMSLMLMEVRTAYQEECPAQSSTHVGFMLEVDDCLASTASCHVLA